jgi:hypothetical protein
MGLFTAWGELYHGTSHFTNGGVRLKLQEKQTEAEAPGGGRCNVTYRAQGSQVSIIHEVPRKKPIVLENM